MFLWCDTQLVVEGVVPDLFHVVPICDDSVFNGVLEGEDTSLRLRLVPYVGVFLPHSDHDARLSGSTDDRGENCAWGVVPREASFAHSGSVVDNKRGDVLFCHVGVWFVQLTVCENKFISRHVL